MIRIDLPDHAADFTDRIKTGKMRFVAQEIPRQRRMFSHAFEQRLKLCADVIHIRIVPVNVKTGPDHQLQMMPFRGIQFTFFGAHDV